MIGCSVRGRVAVAVGALLAGALAGCDSGPRFEQEEVTVACPTQAGGPVTLVVGARANSPRPQLPDEALGLVREAAKRGQKVQIVRVDGVPTVALTATFATKGRNQEIRDRDLQNFLKQTVQFVGGLQSKAPEADILGALTQAGQITPDGGTIVLMDSGVATTGPLSFQNPDMFGTAPADVASFLTDQRLMPDLSGTSVVLAGLGDTADPQPQLAGNLHSQIVDLWTAVATKAGAACVHNLKVASTRTAITTTVPVTVVKPPAPPTFTDCGTTVLADSSSVGFVVGKAIFRDAAAAKATLERLAHTLTGHTQKVTLTGTTSSEGSESSNQTLSEQRAAAVKAVLVRLGVEETRIAATGRGEHGPDRVPDTTKNGVLIPAAAAHNRSVVVKLTCRR